MTNNFKVGDKVRCIYNSSRIKITDSLHYITIGKTYHVNYPIDYTKEDKIVIVNDLYILYDYHSNRFELVERKIGDVWVKAEDLDKMEKIKFDKNKCGHTNYDGKELDMDKKEEFKCGDTVECIMDNPEYNLFRGAVFEVENHPDWGLIILRKNPNERIVGIDSKHFRLTKKHVEEKEEFKVDKLGYYRCKNKNKVVKIIHKNEYGENIYPMMGVHLYNDSFCDNWDENGNYYNNSKTEYNLVEYLGPELPKEPRVFEFESNYINPYRGGFIDLDPEIEDELTLKKWHVTMKEILK